MKTFIVQTVLVYVLQKKPMKHRNVWKNHDYCYIEMPKKDSKNLKYNHVEKSMKVAFIIYADH